MSSSTICSMPPVSPTMPTPAPSAGIDESSLHNPLVLKEAERNRFECMLTKTLSYSTEKPKKIAFTFTLQNLFQTLFASFRENGVELFDETVSLTGSQMGDLVRGEEKHHQDTDFLLRIPKPKNPYKVQKAFLQALEKLAGLKPVEAANGSKIYRQKNFFYYSEDGRSIFEHGGLKSLSIYNGYIPFSIPLQDHWIDISIVWDLDCVCFSSIDCWQGSFTPDSLALQVKTAHDYDPQLAKTLSDKKLFYVEKDHIFKLRNGLFRYIHALTKGWALVPEKRPELEKAFYEKWLDEYGAINGSGKTRPNIATANLSSFFKNTAKFIDKYYKNPLSAAAFLCNLSSFFKAHEGSSKLLQELDRLAEERFGAACNLSYLQTIFCWLNAPPFHECRLDSKDGSAHLRYTLSNGAGISHPLPWKETLLFLLEPEPILPDCFQFFSPVAIREWILQRLEILPPQKEALPRLLSMLAKRNKWSREAFILEMARAFPDLSHLEKQQLQKMLNWLHPDESMKVADSATRLDFLLCLSKEFPSTVWKAALEHHSDNLEALLGLTREFPSDFQPEFPSKIKDQLDQANFRRYWEKGQYEECLGLWKPGFLSDLSAPASNLFLLTLPENFEQELAQKFPGIFLPLSPSEQQFQRLSRLGISPKGPNDWIDYFEQNFSLSLYWRWMDSPLFNPETKKILTQKAFHRFLAKRDYACCYQVLKFDPSSKNFKTLFSQISKDKPYLTALAARKKSPALDLLNALKSVFQTEEGLKTTIQMIPSLLPWLQTDPLSLDLIWELLSQAANHPLPEKLLPSEKQFEVLKNLWNGMENGDSQSLSKLISEGENEMAAAFLAFGKILRPERPFLANLYQTLGQKPSFEQSLSSLLKDIQNHPALKTRFKESLFKFLERSLPSPLKVELVELFLQDSSFLSLSQLQTLKILALKTPCAKEKLEQFAIFTASSDWKFSIKLACQIRSDSLALKNALFKERIWDATHLPFLQAAFDATLLTFDDFWENPESSLAFQFEWAKTCLVHPNPQPKLELYFCSHLTKNPSMFSLEMLEEMSLRFPPKVCKQAALEILQRIQSGSSSKQTSAMKIFQKHKEALSGLTFGEVWPVLRNMLDRPSEKEQKEVLEFILKKIEEGGENCFPNLALVAAKLPVETRAAPKIIQFFWQCVDRLEGDLIPAILPMISRPSDHLLKTEDWQKLLSLILDKIKESSDQTKNLTTLLSFLQQMPFPGFKWEESDFLRALEAFDTSHTDDSQAHETAALIWARLLAIHGKKIEAKETYLRIVKIFRTHLEIFSKNRTQIPAYSIPFYKTNQRSVRFAEDLLEELDKVNTNLTQWSEKWINIVDIEWKIHELPLLIESLCIRASKLSPEVALQSIFMLQLRLFDCLNEWFADSAEAPLFIESAKILHSIHILLLEIEERLDPKELNMDASALNLFRYKDQHHNRQEKISRDFLPMEKQELENSAEEMFNHKVSDVLLCAYTIHSYLLNFLSSVQLRVNKIPPEEIPPRLFIDLSKETFQSLVRSKSLKYSILPLLIIARELFWPFANVKSEESDFLLDGFLFAMKDGPFKTLDINEKKVFLANLVVGMTTENQRTTTHTHVSEAFQFLQKVVDEPSFKIDKKKLDNELQIAYACVLSDIAKIQNVGHEFLSMALTCSETLLPFYKEYLATKPTSCQATNLVDESKIRIFKIIEEKQLFEFLIKKTREVGNGKMKKRALALQGALQFTKK